MNTCDVQRFDRSKPPPGRKSYGMTSLVLGVNGEGLQTIAATWAQHQERNDPPGMPVEYVRPTDPLWVAAHDGWWVYTTVVGGMLCLFRRDDEASARAAAWAWYWRRVALADALICFDPRKVKWDPDVWPRCLAWSDEQVAAVERWLAEGGELPEVLRG